MKIQGAIATELIIGGLALTIIPTILIVLMPIIDNALTPQALNTINNAVDLVEQFLGSTNTNLLFAIIGLMLVIMPIKWLFRWFRNH